MKQCLVDPYQEQAGKLKEGDTVTGRVSRITNFGAFVEISPGVEGLIHISQLSEERVNRVQSVVRVDEVVTVKVLDIDQKNRRISLSLRAARKAAEPDVLRADDPGLKKLRARFGGNLKGGIG
jgi:ribosomal protein S1